MSERAREARSTLASCAAILVACVSFAACSNGGGVSGGPSTTVVDGKSLLVARYEGPDDCDDVSAACAAELLIGDSRFQVDCTGEDPPADERGELIGVGAPESAIAKVFARSGGWAEGTVILETEGPGALCETQTFVLARAASD